MILRKMPVRLCGFLTFVWYKLIYRVSFRRAGVPKVRRGLSLVIDKGGKVSFGKGVFINSYCPINCKAAIFIGNNCLSGEGVKIYDHNHRFRDLKTPIAEQEFRSSPVSIGNDSWIGSNVVIIKNAKIGDQVVGDESVIGRVIHPHSIVRSSFPQIDA